MTDYYSSPEYARVAASTAKQAGVREGHSAGYQQGYDEGWAQGRTYGVDEACRSLIQDFQAQAELMRGESSMLGVMSEVLFETATEEQKLAFARLYLIRIDHAIKNGWLARAPHVDKRYSDLTRTMRFIDDALVAFSKATSQKASSNNPNNR